MPTPPRHPTLCYPDKLHERPQLPTADCGVMSVTAVAYTCRGRTPPYSAILSRVTLAFCPTVSQNAASLDLWEHKSMFDTAAARRMMVDGQVRTADVTDPDLIAAMLAVPRELFVPPALAGQAYSDGDLAVGNGRSMLKPM